MALHSSGSDERLPPDILSERTRDGGSSMVLAGIIWRSKTSLVVDGNLNANEYVNMLSVRSLPFRDEHHAGDSLFQ